MSKAARRPEGGIGPRPIPSLEDCLYHRCSEHENIRQLNATEEQTNSECGACIAEALVTVQAQNLLILDGYADRLTYSSMLRSKLLSARDRLNLLQPGAGDFLNDLDQENPDAE